MNPGTETSNQAPPSPQLPRSKDPLERLLKSIQQTRRFEVRHPFRNLLAILGALASSDQRAEVQIGKSEQVRVAGLLGTVATFLALAVTLLVSSTPPPWLLLFGVVLGFACLGLTLSTLPEKKRWQTRDVPNDFRVSLLPFLKALEPKIAPGAEVRGCLSFFPREKDLKTPKAKSGAWVRRPWCELTTTLLDGSSLNLTLVNRYRARREVRSGGRLHLEKEVLASISLERGASSEWQVSLLPPEIPEPHWEARVAPETVWAERSFGFDVLGSPSPKDTEPFVHPARLIDLFDWVDGLRRPRRAP